MGRRGENIFKRKDGRWEARFAVGRNAAGAVRYRSVYGKTYSEAKEKRRVAMQSSYTPKSQVLFADVILKWLAEKEKDVKEQSARKYRLSVETHILPYFGTMKASEISEETVEDFLKEMKEHGRLDGKGGLSQNTVRGLSIILQSIVDYAYQKRLGIPQTIRIKKPKLHKRAVAVLNHDEQRRLEAAICEDPHNASLAIYLALGTGLRIGEVCALRWIDVDFAGRKLQIRGTVIRTKEGKTTIGPPKSETSARSIPLPSHLVRLLGAEKDSAASVFIFEAPNKGTFLDPRTLQYRFKALLKRCGLPPTLTFHSLRHTFATRWIECGMDVKSLSEVLGHASVQITLDIYVHSSEKMKREAIEKISGQFSGQ